MSALLTTALIVIALCAFSGALLGAYLAIRVIARKLERPIVLDGLGVFRQEDPFIAQKREEAKREMGSEYILDPSYRADPRHAWRA